MYLYFVRDDGGAFPFVYGMLPEIRSFCCHETDDNISINNRLILCAIKNLIKINDEQICFKNNLCMYLFTYVE